MRVFTCEEELTDMLTCIYDAWVYGIKNGHEQLRIEREPVTQLSLFSDYVHIEPDEEKAEKVMRSVRCKISEDAFWTVYYASLSREDVLDDVYRFLQIGFRYGCAVNQMLTEPAVMRLMPVRRSVANEIHSMREFARFDAMEGGTLVCHLEPKHNVIYAVSQYFADRMPSENWMMIDDNRKTAAVHPSDGETYIRHLTHEELTVLKTSEERSDQYRDLWCAFFDAIAIKQRENPRCQRNMFPIWMRRHAPEMHQR